MKKSMIAVLASASVLVGILYQLPKVIVSDKEKQLAGSAPEQVAGNGQSASELPANHDVPLSPEQLSAINRLRNQFLSDPNKEKKIKFADSLATAFAQASKLDSAAKYLEAIATLNPLTATMLRAGNGYYDAFGFAVDSERAAFLGEKAREYYQKVLDRNPGILEAKTKMAMTYVTTANPMQGIMLLREVLAEDPKNEPALFNLGILSMRSGQYDKAIDRFQQILRLNPENAQAQLYLGVSYFETGKKQDAGKIFNALKQKETDPAIQTVVAEYLQKLN